MNFRSFLVLFCALFCGAGISCSGSPEFLDGGWEAGWTASPREMPEFQAMSGPTALPPGRGTRNFIVYRTHLPPKYLQVSGQALLFKKIRYQFEIKLDGQSLYQFGPLNDAVVQKFYGFPVHLVELPPDGSQSGAGELIVIVYSPETRIGITEGPVIGSKSDLVGGIYFGDMPDILIAGFLVFLALISAVFFIRSGEFRKYLDFSGLCFFFGLYLLAGSEFKQLTLGLPLVFDNFRAACAFSIPLFWLRYFRSMFPHHKFLFLKVMEWINLLVLLVFPALSVLGYFELIYSMPVFQVVVLATVAAYVAALVILAKGGNDAAKKLIFGMSLVALAALNDILIDQQLVRSVTLLGTATILYILQFGILTASSIRSKFQVSATTRRDLQVASLVQNSYLQKKRLNILGHRLIITYKSANEIGGDWYHYTLIKERYLHLHIADITGHGPQAALGACYIKGIVDSFYRMWNGPNEQPVKMLGELHVLINHHLLHNTGEATNLTLLSLVVDLLDKKFCYFNSAHLPPFVFDTKKLRTTPYTKFQGTYLGMDEVMKRPDNLEWLLLPDQAILCVHTDGLYEIEPYASMLKGFKRTCIFLESGTNHSDEGIHESVDDLVHLQKCQHLLDDLTVITLQLDVDS